MAKIQIKGRAKMNKNEELKKEFLENYTCLDFDSYNDLIDEEIEATDQSFELYRVMFEEFIGVSEFYKKHCRGFCRNYFKYFLSEDGKMFGIYWINEEDAKVEL